MPSPAVANITKSLPSHRSGKSRQNSAHAVNARPGLISRLIAPVLVTLGLILPVPEGHAAETVGATAGQFGTTPSGAATYSIPIQVPPGTTGVQPNLALSYSSQAGNGVMGMGWSIAGMSFITRCETNLYYDGYTDPVDFDSNDQYCLNGERLVPISGAADNSVNGQNGTEYRTHQEEFSKIISYGRTGNGPSYFKVWKKSGELLTYGNSSNSRIEAQGRTEARAWALWRIEDRRRNYIDFIYSENTGAGTLRLNEVKYTGNLSTGLAPYNSVKFIYQGRSDKTKAYLAGSLIFEDQRLSRIEVKAGSTIVRRYTIAYGAGASGRSRPTSITECGLNGSDCFRPTTFQWSSDGSAKLINKAQGSANGVNGSAFTDYHVMGTGDFNRDGRQDLYLAKVDGHGRSSSYNNVNYLLQARSDGTFQRITLPSNVRVPARYGFIASGDFNGDGNTDFYAAKLDERGRSTGENGDRLFLSNGSGGFTIRTKNLITSALTNHAIASIGDFNGDGLTDIYWYRSHSNGEAQLSAVGTEEYEAPCDTGGGPGGGTFLDRKHRPAPGGRFAGGFGAAKQTLVQPIVSRTGFGNGDDTRPAATGNARLRLAEGGGAGWQPPQICTFTRSTFGLKQYIWYGKRLSNSDATFTRTTLGTTEGIPVGYEVAARGDFNGDGITDMYLADWDPDNNRGSGGGDGKTLLSDGRGNFTLKNTGQRFPQFYSPISVGDFNGDGLTDFYLGRMHHKGWISQTSTTPDKLWLSKGNGSFVRTDLPISASGYTRLPNYYRVMASGDFDGDGLTDFYAMRVRQDWPHQAANEPGQHDMIYRSKGDGSFTKITLSQSNSGLTGSATYKYTIAASGDFDGDGLTDLYAWHTDGDGHFRGTSNTDYTFLSAWNYPDVMTKVTNGLGLWTEMLYKPMSDTSVYKLGGGSAYPKINVITPGHLLAEVKADNGIGGANIQKHEYEAFRTNITGLGGLGFAKMTITDMGTGIRTINDYSTDYTKHFQGLLTRSRTIAPASAGGVTLTDQQVTWAVKFRNGFAPSQRHGTKGASICYRYTTQTRTTQRDLNGDVTSVITEKSTYDLANTDLGYGFPTRIEVKTEAAGKSFTKITDNTYTHSPSSWINGRLTHASVTHKASGQADQIRRSEFTYTGQGEVLSETIEPGSSLWHRKTNTYNAYGAVTRIRETWNGTGTDYVDATSRDTTYQYDDKSRFRTRETNPLGHSQTNVFDANLGLVTATTGPNGLTTSWQYDGFGRVTRETRADGTSTTTIRERCDGSFWCGDHAIMRTRVDAPGDHTTITDVDRLLRERRTASIITGRYRLTYTEYDSLGRVSRKQEPRLGGSAATTSYWTTSEYDLLGRPTRTTRPDGSVQTAAYQGLTQVSTNERGQTKTIIQDALGRTVEARDSNNRVTTYTYDAIGQLTKMTALPEDTTLGFSQTYRYDIRGNKIEDNDPDKGTWTYRYNALGHLTEQRDAKGQKIITKHDALDRPVQRWDRTAAGSDANITHWTYDSGNKAKGKPTSIESTGTGNNYHAAFTYDNVGRPSSTTETIDGRSYSTTTTYDAYSRVLTTSYPSGLITRNVYGNNYLWLTEVRNDLTGAALWTFLASNSRGQVTQARLGNGVIETRAFKLENGELQSIVTTKGTTVLQDLSYTFDRVGNLTQRRDKVQNLTENFQYDWLNRVTATETLYQGGQAPNNTTAYSYDAIGNILTKSDTGTYSYGQRHAACSAAERHAGKNALTQVTGAKNATYCYDANGNMTRGDGRIVTYSVFGKPTRIVKGSATIDIAYGPDRARFKRSDATATGTTTTRYLMGGAYEEITRPNLITEQKHYIGDFAVITEFSNSSIAQTRYLHRDHQGSIDAISDENGAAAQRLSFDSWGKRREYNWTSLAMASIAAFDTSITTRGYTGHEMLDPVGLIHMNGRVYDPELGKFLSADPNIQDIENLQNWNRYAYVLNNPLSYTDPSGFFFSKIFKAIGKVFGKIFKAIGAAFKAILKIPLIRSIIQIAACASPIGVVGCAATAAALAVAAGGSLTDALIAGATSLAQFGAAIVGEALSASLNIAAQVSHGVTSGLVGGAASAATGGNFFEGFAAGAIGGATGATDFGPLPVKTAVAAVAGGTASVITGGKFANGAVTGAFAATFGNFVRNQNGVGGYQYEATSSTNALSIRPASGTGAGTIGVGVVAKGLVSLLTRTVLFPVAVVAQGVYDLLNKSYLTYILQNETGVRYIGRTSGYGDPASILARRLAGHFHYAVLGFRNVEVDQIAQGRGAKSAIRGREQQLIDHFGGPRTSGVANLIRGVSRLNRNGRIYHNASNQFFGELHPFTGFF